MVTLFFMTIMIYTKYKGTGILRIYCFIKFIFYKTIKLYFYLFFNLLLHCKYNGNV
jgi:hypothetical protein